MKMPPEPGSQPGPDTGRGNLSADCRSSRRRLGGKNRSGKQSVPKSRPKTARSTFIIPELLDELKAIDAEQEEAALTLDPEFPWFSWRDGTPP